MVRIERIVLQGFKSFKRMISIPFPVGFSIITGPNGVGKSCSFFTDVMLPTGELRPIGEIVENNLKEAKNILKLDDGVCTLENSKNIKALGLDPELMKIVEKNISAFIKRDGEKYLYKIKTKTGRSVTTTGCHPVMVFKDLKVKSSKVKNLKEGYFIATPREIKLQNSKMVDFESKKIDKWFARFVGYLIGDGYITHNRIELVNADQKILNDFEQLAKKIFNLDLQYRKKESKATRLIFWSNELPRFLRRLFRSKSVYKLTSSYKKIPPEFLISNDKVVANLLAAIFDCDAYIRKDLANIEYSSKNEKLVDQVQLLLLRFGITARKKEKLKYAANTENRIKRKYYYLYIEGSDNLKKFCRCIPLRCKQKRERLIKFGKRKVITNPNVDVVPSEVNSLIKECRKTLYIAYKPLRKKHPRFAAYNENRCCPTREGIKEAVSIFTDKIKKLEKIKRDLRLDQKLLLMSLEKIGISGRHTSRAIGLGRDTVNGSWRCNKWNAKPENLKKLYLFIKEEISRRLKKAYEIIKILKAISYSDIFWDQIVSIRKIKGEPYVYDLMIPNCHNFIANGIFVHNSNISDAICFVLGIPSSKSLRAKKASELIFHGSNGKEPSSYAKVTLYFDNTGRSLPLEDKIVSVAKRINQKGISTYRLNGRIVNRQAVVDLLTQGGIHADGHNIIHQGDVNDVIDMQSVERRGIIDEIAGIREYDEKKERALKELEKVAEKVREVEIILEQKDQIFEKLKAEREVALEYKRLQNLIELIKATAVLKILLDSEKRLKNVKGKLTETNEEAINLENEIKDIDNKISAKESKLEEITQAILQASSQIELSKKITELKSEIEIKKERLEMNEMEINRLEDLIERLTSIDIKVNPAVEAVLKMQGVKGKLLDLITIPEKYKIAVEVAAGMHLQDVVVDSYDNAIKCVKYLKEGRIGRARFLPLDKIKAEKGKKLPKEAIGWLADLIHYDSQYNSIINFIFGTTACVENIDKAKAILKSWGKVRMVTLDGDLIERSGAITGGYYKKRKMPNIEEYIKIRENLEKENESLGQEIKSLEKKLRDMTGKEKYKGISSLEMERKSVDDSLKKLREKRRELYEKRIGMQEGIGKFNIKVAKIEAGLENATMEWEKYKDMRTTIEKSGLLKESILNLRQKQADAILKIDSLGPVNLKAIEEFETFKKEFDEFKSKVDRIVEEKKSIEQAINRIETKKKEVFMLTLGKIAKEFKIIYSELTNGKADLRLEDANNLESGLLISASPAGKKLLNIDAMSGGEKTLTAFAFLFAIQNYKPAPFYILDETDATLDIQNTKRVANLIKKQSKIAQFIIISHNDDLIREADQVYGVSMEDGESKIIGIKLPEV